MGFELLPFWQASQALSKPDATEEEKHEARVALLEYALKGDNKVGNRAAEMLRGMGLVVIRTSNTLHSRAV